MTRVASTLSGLQALDARVLAADPSWRTLAPGRARAHLPSEIAADLAPDDPAVAEALVEGMHAVYEAMLLAFPENLLWDLDAVFAAAVRVGVQGGGASSLAAHLRAVAGLQGLFGDAPVGFRYIHDFVYGYDWAKWVARDPSARAQVRPFDRPFLDAMRRRGEELVAVIEAGGDPKYPPIPAGQRRNPFGFSREPEAEVQLHRHLAAAGSLPVEAWRAEAQTRWDRPFAELRKRAAAELGLLVPTS